MNEELTPSEAWKLIYKSIEDALKDYETLQDDFNKLYERTYKEHKALEIIKVLFKGRAKLYTRDDGIEKTIDKNGNYKKAPIGLYILEFWVGDNHYEFHLHREEYDLLKEVLS